MDWVFDHLQLIIWAAALIAGWLVQRRLRREQERTLGTHPRPAGSDSGDAGERTRRIQEEIRRRIAERQGRLPPPETRPESPGPSDAEPMDDRAETPPPPVISAAGPAPQVEPPLPPLTAPEMSPGAELLARALADQRRMAEQSVALAEPKSPVMPPAAAAPSTAGQPTAPALPGGTSRSRLFDDLRQPDTLRRAILAREILGPPKAIR